jgi:hypothetical protein
VNRRALGALAAALAIFAHQSCAARPLHIGLAFENDWRVGRGTLTIPEQAAVRAAALQTLQRAFRGFDVTVREGRNGDRLVIVDSGFVVGFGPRGQPAPVGETFPFAVVSRVHFEEILRTMLTVAGCTEMAVGCTKSRAELVEGLGRGIGGTAAHELGHQVGFRFALDATCDACYDGHTSKAYAHFFGEQHWSDAALAIMRRVLPREVSVHRP